MGVPDVHDAALQALARAVAERLRASGRRLALAESCTGGWIAKLCTDLPGSSRWFERGWVTYSDAAKQHDLGVPERLLAAHGAVSREVVEAMARGALAASGADIALAVSGIAGPDGGSVDKPVGTVWLALALVEAPEEGAVARSQRLQLLGDRDAIRRASVSAALAWVAGT